jgi:amidase
MLNRRSFLIVSGLIASLLASGLTALNAQMASTVKRPLNIAQFDAAIKSISPARVAELDAALTHATIPQVQQLFQQGQLTSEELVKYYLWRIKQYDLNRLNSVTELNPDALEIAKQLDAERKAGKVRGPLHGTAVLLKDIIGTGDKLHNTAGAAAMREAKSDRDAFIVKRLREAGVIILGKSSLTEWGNFIAFKQLNGYSTLGGQVINPYRTASDPGGSSTGSAVATAANFTTFAIGEDSWGSLLIPAHANSTATLRPSIGLVSRDRMMPIVGAHDTAGPMTRSLTDLALVMEVLVGTDPNDPITTAAASVEKGFAQKLNGDGLRGKRVGVFAPISPDDDAINNTMIAALQKAGAQVVQVPRLPSLVPGIFDDLDPITAYWVKHAGEKYFADTNAPVKTWKEIVAFNDQDPKNRVKYGQEYLVITRDSTMTADEYDRGYRAMLSTWKSQVDAILAKDNLDFLAGTGWAFLDGVFFPATGYPVLALPAGYRPNNEPVGFILMGKRFDDTKLIRAGYALEQQTKVWRAPSLGK